MLEKLPQGIGHALVNQRAGMEQVVYNRVYHEKATQRIDVTSAAFAFNARMPSRFTADGEGLSPPLAWADVPPGTASIAIIVEDADAPTPHPLVHAIVVELPGEAGGLDEGALTSPQHTGVDLDIGRNSFFRQSWLPPDPPPGHGEHRYVFQVFALSEGKPFSKVPGRGELLDAILARALGSGCIIGTYIRENLELQPIVGDEVIAPTPA